MLLVSTIIPAYNAQDFIAETIESALAQTYADHEIIVVDDGSTDRTCEIVDAYRDKVRLIRQENAGPAAARNRGVQESTGEWIAFLDADDLWYENKLTTQIQRAGETGALFVYANRISIGDCEHVSKLQSDAVELVEGDIFTKLLVGNVITLSSVLLRKDVFVEAGGFNEDLSLKAVEDWELWLRISEKHEIALCREPLLEYRFHTDGISRSVATMEQNLFNVLEIAMETPRGREISKSTRSKAYAAAWSVLGWSASAENPRSAMKYYIRAWRYAPLNVRYVKQIVKSIIGRA